MNYIVCEYKGNSRELKKIIVVLLKSGVANDVKKMNYVHNYSFKDNKVERGECQLFIIGTEDKEKLIDFLSKNFPQIGRIYLS